MLGITQYLKRKKCEKKVGKKYSLICRNWIISMSLWDAFFSRVPKKKISFANKRFAKQRKKTGTKKHWKIGEKRKPGRFKLLEIDSVPFHFVSFPFRSVLKFTVIRIYISVFGLIVCVLKSYIWTNQGSRRKGPFSISFSLFSSILQTHTLFGKWWSK